MLQQSSQARFTRFRAGRRAFFRACVLFALFIGVSAHAIAAATDEDIRLELRPRICTLSAIDKQCETQVQAKWQATHEESLCLVIVNRPEIKRCWEHYTEGTYSIELTFAEDVIFQLTDIELQHVLASEALRVIREALRYRHKRREPWNIFD
jgi:DUF3019 family protein